MRMGVLHVMSFICKNLIPSHKLIIISRCRLGGVGSCNIEARRKSTACKYPVYSKTSLDQTNLQIGPDEMHPSSLSFSQRTDYHFSLLINQTKPVVSFPTFSLVTDKFLFPYQVTLVMRIKFALTAGVVTMSI